MAGVEIAVAIVVALVVGGLGGRLTVEARRRGWASPASESLAVVALAIVAYAGATAIGGNGFVAAFGAGIAFRTATGLSEPSVEFAESIGLAASYLVWLLFGVGLAGPAIAAGFDPAVIGYALLSLTVVRMVPVAIALAGARVRPDTVALIGWFGPRGLASVVFLLVAFDDLGPAHPATDALMRVVTWTVLLSVFLHGLSAGPLGAWYGRRMARAGAGDWEARRCRRTSDQPPSFVGSTAASRTLTGLPAGRIIRRRCQERKRNGRSRRPDPPSRVASTEGRGTPMISLGQRLAAVVAVSVLLLALGAAGAAAKPPSWSHRDAHVCAKPGRARRRCTSRRSNVLSSTVAQYHARTEADLAECRSRSPGHLVPRAGHPDRLRHHRAGRPVARGRDRRRLRRPERVRQPRPGSGATQGCRRSRAARWPSSRR